MEELETHVITGIGMTRLIFVDGVNLEAPDGVTFDWGYAGESCTLLARKLKDILKLRATVEEVAIVLVSCLPSKNFTVLIHTAKFNNWHRIPATKPRLMGGIMDVLINDEFAISKIIDFPNLGIKSASFAKGTIEHKHLTKLMDNGKLNTFRTYCEKRTKTPDVTAKNKVTCNLKFVGEYDTFEYTGGLGSNHSDGHKIEDYEF